MIIKDPVSFTELEKITKIPRSTFEHYTRKRLLRPIAKVGKTYIFEKEDVLKILKAIKSQKKRGKDLIAIREKIFGVENENNREYKEPVVDFYDEDYEEDKVEKTSKIKITNEDIEKCMEKL